jgi:hypothetical protein
VAHPQKRFGAAQIQSAAANFGLVPEFEPAGVKRFIDIEHRTWQIGSAGFIVGKSCVKSRAGGSLPFFAVPN